MADQSSGISSVQRLYRARGQTITDPSPNPSVVIGGYFLQTIPVIFQVLFREQFGRDYLTPKHIWTSILLILVAMHLYTAVMLGFAFFPSYALGLRMFSVEVPSDWEFSTLHQGSTFLSLVDPLIRFVFPLLSVPLFLLFAIKVLSAANAHRKEAVDHFDHPAPERDLNCTGWSRVLESAPRFRGYSTYQVQTLIEPAIIFGAGALISLVTTPFGVYLMVSGLLYAHNERTNYRAIERRLRKDYESARHAQRQYDALSGDLALQERTRRR